MSDKLTVNTVQVETDVRYVLVLTAKPPMSPMEVQRIREELIKASAALNAWWLTDDKFFAMPLVLNSDLAELRFERMEVEPG